MMPYDYNQPIQPAPQAYKAPKSVQPYDPYTRYFQDNYPSKYVIIHSLLIAVLSICAIAIQIVLIIRSAPLSVIGSGIWIGIFYIIAVALALLNIKYASYCIYTTTSIMHSLGIMMSVTAMLTLNVIAYTSLYSNCTDDTPNTTTTTGFLSSLAGSKCGSPDELHIVMMVIAALYVILSIVFLSVMACKLGECGHRSTYNQVGPTYDAPRTQYPGVQQRIIYH